MPLNDTEEQELLELLEAEEEHKRYNLIDYRFPDHGFNDNGCRIDRELYTKHLEFFSSGKDYMIRLFCAGNRCGKSESGSYELALHSMGRYPVWWKGLTRKKPGVYWAACYTNEKVRDGIHKSLLGDYNNWGTGLIPKERIKHRQSKHNVAGLYDYVEIWWGENLEYAKQHNLYSTIFFKTYDAEVRAFTSTNCDGVLLDEIPKLSIYLESKQRVVEKRGFVMITFTPDQGMNETTLAFWPDGDYSAGVKSDNKYVVLCSVYDAPHLTEDMINEMLEDMPPHLAQAKLYGIPYLGAGAVYPVAREQIIVDPFKIPDYWPRVYGMDTGHVATAALWAAINPDTNVIYLYAEYKEGQQPPAVHSEAIKKISQFKQMWGIVDCHSQNRVGAYGTQDYKIYEDLGLNLIPSDGSAGVVEAGILDVYDMFCTGQLKIMSHLTKTLAEYGVYRRGDDGRPIKRNDHLMDCLRYIVRHGLNMALSPLDVQFDEFDMFKPKLSINLNRSKITGY